ncbi:urea ABC transporter substrate-binding protein [Thiocapsa imhoffii]|uniref:Urea ABC transporter substrate-binding protein n=2 Tax=Thiocapsa imhoffii TaxID=382777 RepID=A0A9X0WJW5_9GAMM|nr:urea ABC transporter substrate-binding protein [Thiocapsa imhoffii]
MARTFRFGLLLLALIGVGFASLSLLGPRAPVTPAPIRIGVVHALSGAMAESERGLVDALRLAIDELNSAGGLLGRPLELILIDSRSDWTLAAAAAERLITEEKVSALFACWTSSCRRALKPVVEAHQHLMFYPLQYEGLEQSPRILYLGAAPNQQIIPGARWALDRFGTRVYLVGSDYIFPRLANQFIRDLTNMVDGTVVAEHYVSMNEGDFSAIMTDLGEQMPDVVFNTLNGIANRSFFDALSQAGLTQIPVVSFSVAEPELRAMKHLPPHPLHFAVWGYFQSLPSEANRAFVAAFQQRYGPDRTTSDPLVASYQGVKLWAAAVAEAGTDNPRQINRTITRMSVAGPSGILVLDAGTRHAWRRVYVGQARADGQFDAAELSAGLVRPLPFPPLRSRDEWLALVATVAATMHNAAITANPTP